MQFSLRDLLILFVFAAIFCWCAAQVGPDNGVFWFVVVVTSVVSAFYARAVHNQAYGNAAAIAFGGLGFFIFLVLGMFVALAVIVNFLLQLIALLGFVRFRPHTWRPILVVVGSCAAIAFSYATYVGLPGVRRMQALRREYPIVSLADRLAHESVPPTTAPKQTKALNERLQLDEDRYYDDWGRSRMLRQLHSRSYEKFVRAQGFGIGRMLTPRKETLELPPLESITFQSPQVAEWNNISVKFYFNPLSKKASPLEDIYETSRFDFTDDLTLGHTFEPRKRIAGFQPHAASIPPTNNLAEDEAVTLNRLELVSLLKYPEPRVYVLDHLPRMDQLSAKDAPTRSLDEFEVASLAKLRTAEDLVIDQSQTPVRMLGSLRASNRCLDCHNVQRGELLGAFSYALTMGRK
jgi:hypothetical protein